MEFWNYCPNCGKRLVPNEKFCSSCGTKTILNADEEIYIFSPPVHDIGFFNFKIDFSPYINRNQNFDYDICSCGFINDVNNEFCYHCGSKRIETGLSRFIKKFEKPKLDIDNLLCNNNIVCKCGAVNDAGSIFCDMCGCKLTEDMEFDDNYSNFNLEFDNSIFCVCGEENAGDSLFCRNCGLPLSSYGKLNDIKKVCVCSVLNDLTSDFCVECGTPLNEEILEIICVCGNRSPIDARFCSFCERPLNPDRVLKTKIACSCGRIMNFDSGFCPDCGKNIKKIINRKKIISKNINSVKKLWNGI